MFPLVHGQSCFLEYLRDQCYVHLLSTQVSVILPMIQHHMRAILICQIYCTIWNMTKSEIIWFDENCMKLNQGKCHFMLAGNAPDILWVKVGENLTWESSQEKLLGLPIDKNLNFEKQLSILCKKVAKFLH